MENCSEVADLLPEVALRSVEGRERSAVLKHVEACPTCETELTVTARIADSLLELAPSFSPPSGFEERILKTIPPNRLASRFKISSLVLTVMSILMLFGTLLFLAHLPRSHTPALRVDIVSGLKRIGSLSINNEGKNVWAYVEIDDLGSTNNVNCLVREVSGKTLFVGTFTIVKGKGEWGTQLKVPLTQIRSFLVSDPSGKVLGQAKFPLQ